MNQTPRDFRKLQVWQRGHALTLAVYRATQGFPGEERFGLTSQLRRSSSSIPTNIAEGCGRGSNRELARFMNMSQGSASETDYHLLLAKDLGYLTPEAATGLIDETQAIDRMLQGYRSKLQADL